MCTLHKSCKTRALDLWGTNTVHLTWRRHLPVREVHDLNVRHALDLCEKGEGHLSFVRRQITGMGDMHLTFLRRPLDLCGKTLDLSGGHTLALYGKAINLCGRHAL